MVVRNMDGWLCKTKRLRGFNLQLHLDAFGYTDLQISLIGLHRRYMID